MPLIFLAVYIGLIFIRPMEWWEPVKYLPLVNYTAIANIMTAFPNLVNDHVYLWRGVPQVRIAIWLLIGATCSYLPVFYLTGMSNVFQIFGKVIVLYILIVLLGRSRGGFRLLLWVVLLSVAWMAVHGILQIHEGAGFGGQGPRWRKDRGVYQIIAYGIFHDPNDLCLAFILALPLLYAEWKAAANPLIKTLALALIPLVGYGAWLTNSRGGFVGIFGMLAAYAIARSKGIRRWMLASVSIILVTTIAPSRFSHGMGIDIGRVNAWGDGLAAFKQGPRTMLFGVGYGNYRDITDDYIPAHNSFLEALVELGFVGYIPWFLLIFTTIMCMRRAIRLKEFTDRQDQLYLAGLFSAMTGYLTAVYFLSRAYNHVLYVLLGLSICQVVNTARDPEVAAEIFGPWRKDFWRGTWLAIGSVVLIYVSVLIANKFGR